MVQPVKEQENMIEELAKKLETYDVINIGGTVSPIVKFSHDELRLPFYQSPGIARVLIEVEYVPVAKSIILASFKAYSSQFLEVEITDETLTRIIFRNLKTVLQTNRLRVDVSYEDIFGSKIQLTLSSEMMLSESDENTPVDNSTTETAPLNGKSNSDADDLMEALNENT